MRNGASGLTRRFLFQCDWTGAARRTLGAIPELANIDFEFSNRPAQSVSVHVELARGAALVAFILLQDGEDKPLLEFSHAFGIKNVTSIHLQDERFQLIFHDRSLSRLNVLFLLACPNGIYFDPAAGAPVSSFGARCRKSNPS